MGIAQRDIVTKISFLDFFKIFFLIAAEGRDDRLRHCVQGKQGTGFACQPSVVLTRIKKKNVNLVFSFWELSSKHLALHNPFFKVAQMLTGFLVPEEQIVL